MRIARRENMHLKKQFGYPAKRGPLSAGFTLIELLVVVLIIGILSAVALPQYTIAVEKSRMAEANVIFKSLVDSCSRFYLENPNEGNIGGSGCFWDNIDIDLAMPKVDGDGEGALTRQGKNFWYSLETSTREIFGCRGDFEQDDDWDYCLNFIYEAPHQPGNITRQCEGRTDKGKKICKATCGAETCNY